jgi:polysaccharide deacetylase 2 family uncharacterized protein YibQ
MESREMVFDAEKKNRISISISDEKELAKKIDATLKRYDNANGFAAFYGEDFLAHQASMEKFGNVLKTKKIWFWDLSKRGSATLTNGECKKKGLRCRRSNLDASSEEEITKALRTARIRGNNILLFELNEKSIELLKNLPSLAEKQGTSLTFADEVF